MTHSTSFWRGLVGIQREVQDLMRFMISDRGSFLIAGRRRCLCAGVDMNGVFLTAWTSLVRPWLASREKCRGRGKNFD